MEQSLSAPSAWKSSLSREVEEYFACGAQVAPGQTVLDVGAHVGTFAQRVAELCRGDVRLLCFEPAPDSYHALQSNFMTNRWLRNTEHQLFPLGLSSAAKAQGIQSFYYFSRSATNSTFDIRSKRREFEIFFEDRSRRLMAQPGLSAMLGGMLGRLFASTTWRSLIWWCLRHAMGLQEITAQVATLGQMLKRNKIARVDLLKIDVEGAELDVLMGLDAETWPRVQQVVMETHNRQGMQSQIEHLLVDHGLTQIAVTQQRALDNGLDSVIMMARRA